MASDRCGRRRLLFAACTAGAWLGAARGGRCEVGFLFSQHSSGRRSARSASRWGRRGGEPLTMPISQHYADQASGSSGSGNDSRAAWSMEVELRPNRGDGDRGGGRQRGRSNNRGSEDRSRKSREESRPRQGITKDGRVRRAEDKEGELESGSRGRVGGSHQGVSRRGKEDGQGQYSVHSSSSTNSTSSSSSDSRKKSRDKLDGERVADRRSSRGNRRGRGSSPQRASGAGAGEHTERSTGEGRRERGWSALHDAAEKQRTDENLEPSQAADQGSTSRTGDGKGPVLATPPATAPGLGDEQPSDFTRICKVLSLRPDQYPPRQVLMEDVFGGVADNGARRGRRGGGGFATDDRRGRPYNVHLHRAYGPGGPSWAEEDAEVTASLEALGLKKREPRTRPHKPPEGRSQGNEEGNGAYDDGDVSEDMAEDDEDDHHFQMRMEQGADRPVIRDRRVVSNQIKDSKLSEYIKDKKRARSSRDRFLADTGLVRSEVHPPQRFVEVYYNSWADDFYTAITTSSSRMGPRWWFREALSHGPKDIMAWVRHWLAMARKHGVLHADVESAIEEALSLDGGGEGGVASRSVIRDAETQRFNRLKDKLRQRREPKIIAIGDVHGCIDEVKQLIKKVAYSPGDLVVFLGDMVAKGPDSLEVVRLAREIGAMSVRGNHENEVIRWSRAMALGVQSNFKSEHYLIAMGLSDDDLEYLRNLPWYISCSDLQLLFVHAGFVSNQRLVKQHPRFMINMRSILADGSVSARYYQDYPWARTWQGPQTVLFGHDARRGMQVYEQALGLDTGCVYGGHLTACILPGRQTVQVAAAEPYIVHRYERILRRAEMLQKDQLQHERHHGRPPPQ